MYPTMISLPREVAERIAVQLMRAYEGLAEDDVNVRDLRMLTRILDTARVIARRDYLHDRHTVLD